MLAHTTETREGRLAMVTEIKSICAAYDTTWEQSEFTGGGIVLTLNAPGGLTTKVYFQGDYTRTAIDTWTLMWYIRGGIMKAIDPKFPGQHISCFQVKQFTASFNGLLSLIDFALKKAYNGSAYQQTPIQTKGV